MVFVGGLSAFLYLGGPKKLQKKPELHWKRHHGCIIPYLVQAPCCLNVTMIAFPVQLSVNNHNSRVGIFWQANSRS